MIAIISDIHGNLEALNAVLADIGKQGVTNIYCLGDLIGYGPDPLPCIELAMDWQVVLQGNFENAFLADDGLAALAGARHARRTILRLRERLEQHPNREAIQRFMNERPAQYADSSAQFVHGTLRDPLNEYLFPEAIYDQTRLRSIGSLINRLCFCGHTHLPGLFVCDPRNEWNYITDKECGSRYSLSDCKTICNVGSVGQPRDEDTRACYVLWNGETIQFRRIPYDIERTIAKIKADGDDDADGDRYRFGR